VNATSFTRLLPGVLRFSTAVRALRRAGYEDTAAFLERHREREARCPEHGPLADPVIATVGTEHVAFICPRCSTPELRDAWEREGRDLV
jgi:hypothetical protein